MSKLQFMLTSGVAAVPGAIMVLLLVIGWLSKADKMSLLFHGISVVLLLASAAAMLMPVAIAMYFDRDTDEAEGDLDESADESADDEESVADATAEDEADGLDDEDDLDDLVDDEDDEDGLDDFDDDEEWDD